MGLIGCPLIKKWKESFSRFLSELFPYRLLLSFFDNLTTAFTFELTGTTTPSLVSIIVWCQSAPWPIAVFGRATVVTATLVNEWEDAAVI